MKKINQIKVYVVAFAFFIVAAFLLAGPKISSAQTEPPKNATLATVIANVNVQNTKIEKQANNVLTISFDVSNNFSQVQPGILLSASLVKNENNLRTPVDEKIIGSEFALKPNEKSHREIVYTVPDFVQGKYEIWLEAQVAGGLPFSIMRVGETTFSGTNNYIEIINDSCFLKIKGESEDKKYTATQGVDIEKNEDLQAVCDLMNHSIQPKKFSAQFQTFQRKTLGPLVGTFQKTDASFTLNSKEKKTVSFDLPKASDPQAYDTKLTLLENGKTISNSSVFHWVLRGVSATIQNIQLDKDSYQKGETAKVSLMITGPADIFPNSRHGAGTDLQGNLSLLVKIQSGQILCGQAQKSPQLSGIPNNIEIPIAENCPEPAVSVILKDSAGNILAERNFFIGKDSQAEMEKASQIKANAKSGKSSSSVLVMLITLLIILLAAYALWRFKKKSSIIVPLLVLGAGLAVSLGAMRPARAIVLTDYYNWVWATGTLDHSPDNPYYPNDPITATGTNIGACYNSAGVLTVTISGSEYSVNSCSAPLYTIDTSCTNYGVATGIAQSVPGNYFATFTLCNVGFIAGPNGLIVNPTIADFFVESPYDRLGRERCVSGDVPYTVISPPIQNGECGSVNNTASCPSPSGNLCLVGTPSVVVDQAGRWQWTCAGTGGGLDTACSATKSIINAACGSVKNTCDPGTVVSPIETSTSWNWTCNTDCNGTSAFCSLAKIPIPGQCKTPPNNKEYCPPATPPSAINELCDKYDPVRPPALSGLGPWSWTCYGQNGGPELDISCQASKGTIIGPKCGTADGKTLCDGLGILTWCAPGNSPIGKPTDDSFETAWQCEGICTSEPPASCSARGKKACGWIETNP